MSEQGKGTDSLLRGVIILYAKKKIFKTYKINASLKKITIWGWVDVTQLSACHRSSRPEPDLRYSHKNLGLEVYACSPSTTEVETGRFMKCAG